MSEELEVCVNAKLMQEVQQLKLQEKETFMANRELDKSKLKRNMAAANVIYPVYVWDKRLKVKREQMPKPPETLYKEIGYDRDMPEEGKEGNKHYRRYYTDELEKVKEIFPKMPFHTADIMRG